MGTADVRGRDVMRIEKSGWFAPLELRELWRFRELLATLVWRDVKARYKQTLFGGVIWSLARPIGTMVIFSAVFGGIAGIKAPGGTPYPLFVFAGLLPWNYFSTSLGATTGSVIGNANLVTKTYFPRVLLPLMATVTPFLDLLLALFVLAGMFAWYDQSVSWQLAFAPGFVALALLSAFGIGLWLSTLTVRYRDVPMVVPFVIQLWMYLTPVVYPVTLVPDSWRRLIALNPMTAVVEGFRWSLIGGAPPTTATILASVGVGLVMAVTGLFFFLARQRRFADVI
jgi:lipopolysaccharide transport system permease protein